MGGRSWPQDGGCDSLNPDTRATEPMVAGWPAEEEKNHHRPGASAPATSVWRRVQPLRHGASGGAHVGPAGTVGVLMTSSYTPRGIRSL